VPPANGGIGSAGHEWFAVVPPANGGIGSAGHTYQPSIVFDIEHIDIVRSRASCKWGDRLRRTYIPT